MPTYPFPGWRRVLFLAALLVVAVVSFAPSTTQGNVTVRVYSLSAQSVVSHVYISFTRFDFHGAGLPNSTGWVTIAQGFPNIDLVSPNNQFQPPTAMSAALHSGRYDTMTVTFSNSTAVIGTRNIGLKAPSMIAANVTLPVPPNGTGDVLLIVSFDYSTLFAPQPSVTLTLLRASAV